MTEKKERKAMYKWLEQLEFNFLNLPKPDISIFLHMPYECSKKLKKNRSEALDAHEKDKNHLLNAEEAYLEIAEMYDFYTIECNCDSEIKTIEEINQELFNYVITKLKDNNKRKIK